MRRASPRFAVGTRRPRRTPGQARAAPCTARASQRPRRCKPSSRSSRSTVERRVSGCGAGAKGFPPVPHESSVRAHRSSITQTLAFDPRRAALHFRPPVLQRAGCREPPPSERTGAELSRDRVAPGESRVSCARDRRDLHSLDDDLWLIPRSRDLSWFLGSEHQSTGGAVVLLVFVQTGSAPLRSGLARRCVAGRHYLVSAVRMMIPLFLPV